MFHPSTLTNLSNQAYNTIKWFVTIASPAIITLYITLSQIWNWGGYEKVVLTISAVTLFLGNLIRISSKRYAKDIDSLFSTDPSPN